MGKHEIFGEVDEDVSEVKIRNPDVFFLGRRQEIVELEASVDLEDPVEVDEILGIETAVCCCDFIRTNIF